jgi:hypothetical protein
VLVFKLLKQFTNCRPRACKPLGIGMLAGLLRFSSAAVQKIPQMEERFTDLPVLVSAPR